MFVAGIKGKEDKKDEKDKKVDEVKESVSSKQEIVMDNDGNPKLVLEKNEEEGEEEDIVVG